MARTPALTTQLKEAKAKIADLEKQLESEKKSRASDIEEKRKHKSELDQLHEFLDAVPGAIARNSDPENHWRGVDRTVITRLAGWLASRN